MEEVFEEEAKPEPRRVKRFAADRRALKALEAGELDAHGLITALGVSDVMVYRVLGRLEKAGQVVKRRVKQPGLRKDKHYWRLAGEGDAARSERPREVVHTARDLTNGSTCGVGQGCKRENRSSGD